MKDMSGNLFQQINPDMKFQMNPSEKEILAKRVREKKVKVSSEWM